MKTKVLKIIEIAFTSLMLFIILVLSIYVIQKLVNKDKPVKLLGYYFYEVDVSGSMYNPSDPDNLLPGDLLFVKKQKEYFVGDVVTFQTEDATTTTTHKIIEKDGNIVTTKGINPKNSPDKPFDEKYIIGKVVNVWHGFGKIKAFILSPYSIVAFVILGIGFIELLSYLKKVASKKETIEKEKNIQNINQLKE